MPAGARRRLLSGARQAWSGRTNKPSPRGCGAGQTAGPRRGCQQAGASLPPNPSHPVSTQPNPFETQSEGAHRAHRSLQPPPSPSPITCLKTRAHPFRTLRNGPGQVTKRSSAAESSGPTSAVATGSSERGLRVGARSIRSSSSESYPPATTDFPKTGNEAFQGAGSPSTNSASWGQETHFPSSTNALWPPRCVLDNWQPKQTCFAPLRL